LARFDRSRQRSNTSAVGGKGGSVPIASEALERIAALYVIEKTRLLAASFVCRF
jgi:hypothetical protein